MPNPSILGLDLPTFSEIKAAKKALPFPDNNSNGPLVIFPTLNDMSAAVLRLFSPQSQPSDDPHLSSLVHAGITWFANTLPEPDLLVKKNFQRKRGGKKRDDDVIERHPFYQLMEEPNPEDTGSDLWKSFAYSWIIKGNVFFIKIRNDFGQVIRIYYEPHFTIKARWRGDKQGEYIPAERSQSVPSIPRDDSPKLKINYWEVDRDGGKFRLEPADVIHFKDGIDPFNTRYGISRIQTILREIYGDSALASYGADLLGGSGTIPYVLGVEDKDATMNIEDLENIKARLIAQTTGANAGKPLVLNARHTFTRTGLTPQELDLRSSRSMAQDIFSAVTGIPAIVLNFSSGLERSIYSNMMEADRKAVTSYLQPIWWHRDQVLTRQLLRDIDQDETHFIESDLSEVGALQEDENARVARVVSMYQGQVIKRSEARAELNFEVDPSGADDVYLVKAGTETVTVEEEEIQRDASIEATQNPPEPQMPPQGQEARLLTNGQPRQLAAVVNKSLPVKSNARQIVIVGGPHTGKTTLAGRLKDELKIANVMHSTDDLMGLGWSESSAVASQWFNDPGEWIIEGVSTARALRKWLQANPERSLDADILVLHEAFTPLLTGQRAMTTGVHSVFRQIEPELERRGARIQKLRSANDAIELFAAQGNAA